MENSKKIEECLSFIEVGPFKCLKMFFYHLNRIEHEYPDKYFTCHPANMCLVYKVRLIVRGSGPKQTSYTT